MISHFTFIPRSHSTLLPFVVFVLVVVYCLMPCCCCYIYLYVVICIYIPILHLPISFPLFYSLRCTRPSLTFLFAYLRYTLPSPSSHFCCYHLYHHSFILSGFTFIVLLLLSPCVVSHCGPLYLIIPILCLGSDDH